MPLALSLLLPLPLPLLSPPYSAPDPQTAAAPHRGIPPSPATRERKKKRGRAPRGGGVSTRKESYQKLSPSLFLAPPLSPRPEKVRERPRARRRAPKPRDKGQRFFPLFFFWILSHHSFFSSLAAPSLLFLGEESGPTPGKRSSSSPSSSSSLPERAPFLFDPLPPSRGGSSREKAHESAR